MKPDLPPSTRPGVAAHSAAADPRFSDVAADAAAGIAIGNTRDRNTIDAWLPWHRVDPMARRRIGALLLSAAVAAVSAAVLAAWLPSAVLDTAALAAIAAAFGAALGCGVVVWGLQREADRRRRDAASKALLRSAADHPVAGISRPLFMELSAREWARARRYGSGAALLLIEVDRHELLRQTHGSTAVDAVMAEMLRLTAPTLRGADVLTRFGPVQMAIFLAQADATGALDVAERVRERTERLEVLFQSNLAGPPQGDAPTLPLPLSLTVSVGVAQLRPAHLQLQSVIDDADDALAMARLAGGNCVRAAPLDAEPRPTPDAWRGDRRTQPK